jgi:hypothetical protein
MSELQHDAAWSELHHTLPHHDAAFSLPEMVCPRCSEGAGCHIERVEVGARREDEEPVTLSIDLLDGQVTPTDLPHASPRRQWVTLLGYCEAGCRWSLTLAQHKGETLVQWVDLSQDSV